MRQDDQIHFIHMSPSPNPAELSVKTDYPGVQLLPWGKRGSGILVPHPRITECCPRYWILSQLTWSADGPEQFGCLVATMNKGKWLECYYSWHGFVWLEAGAQLEASLLTVRERSGRNMCSMSQPFRVLPKGLVSVSLHLKLWQNQHSLDTWGLLRIMLSGKQSSVGGTLSVIRRCTTRGFYLWRERKEWSMHPIFWSFRGLYKRLVSVLPDSECWLDLAYYKYPGQLKTKKLAWWCATVSENQQYSRQTPEKARDYEVLKKRNQQIPLIRNLQTQVQRRYIHRSPEFWAGMTDEGLSLSEPVHKD